VIGACPRAQKNLQGPSGPEAAKKEEVAFSHAERLMPGGVHSKRRGAILLSDSAPSFDLKGVYHAKGQKGARFGFGKKDGPWRATILAQCAPEGWEHSGKKPSRGKGLGNAKPVYEEEKSILPGRILEYVFFQR